MQATSKQHVQSCTICLENMEPKGSIATLNCGHVFHTDCIINWLKRKQTCPTDQGNVSSINGQLVIAVLEKHVIVSVPTNKFSAHVAISPKDGVTGETYKAAMKNLSAQST